MNRRLTSALVVVLLGAGALAGCAGAPDLADDAATGLQTSVQTVANHAAANELAAAVTELDALQAKLDTAVADGDISDERAKAVQAKIDLVRADLAQRIAEAEAAEAQRIADEKTEADRIAAEKAEADRVAAEQAEADRIAQEQAAEDAKDDKDDKGNKGKGNDE
ncbi:hypothetical protein GCM10027413_10520 [Conyzicola nivalis]|uniref:Mucin-associated surface protein n=1 Tax=Conyzicola nivalis TaxID=1477021 RepID=A0A916WIW5_9MICO|nr:mucin-associated surface protein [Conyzicola nivalis]GGB02278.1 hypothetical protein GCM10010979_16110 [Conyzicola nivalis]